jgi:hypothetical protein
MSRVAVGVAAAGVAVLVAGCGGSGRANPPAAAHGDHASLVAKGAPRVCDGLRPVALRMAALKQPGFGELEHYSSVLAGLGQQAYQGADANVTVANLLSEAATAMGEAAISRPAKFLAVARGDVRQAMGLCPASRADHDRD